MGTDDIRVREKGDGREKTERAGERERGRDREGRRMTEDMTGREKKGEKR